MDYTSPITPQVTPGLSAVQSGPTQSVDSIASDLPRSPKRRFNWRILAAIAAVAVLVIGGVAGFILTQQNQDLRQQASGSNTCSSGSVSGCSQKSIGTRFQSGNDTFICEAHQSGEKDSFGNPFCTANKEGGVCAGKAAGVSCNEGDSRRGVCNGSGTCSIQENFCGACNAWFPATARCSDIAANNCRLPGSTGGPAGGSDNDTSPGAPATAACGGSGQACCDPSSRPDGKICENNLFCTNGTCGTSTENLCRGEDGSGQTGSFNNTCNLYICDKCSMYGGNAECRTFTASGNCAEMQARLDAANCGQVDFMQGNNVYCGVKSIKCGGSCAPTEPPTGPAPVQCREIIGRIGQPGAVTAQEVAPRIGEDFFLRCRRVAGASSYRFRYYYTNKNDYATLAGSAVRVPAASPGGASSALIPVDRVGLYYGQCRVCMPDASNPSGERCSAWESRTATKRLPFQEGGPFGNLQGDPTDAAVQDLPASTVDADNDAPRGTIPALRSVFDYDIVTGGPEVSAGQPQTDTTQNTQTVDQPATE